MLHPSSLTARITTVVITLRVTPIALNLIGSDVLTWRRISARSWNLFLQGHMLPATGFIVLGIALLIGIVFTGM